MTPWLRWVLLAVCTAGAVDATPEADVAKAIADLLEQKNYSWTRTFEDDSELLGRPAPLGSARTTSAPPAETHGRTEQDGLTRWTANLGFGTPPREIAGVTDEYHCVVDYGDGWVTFSELTARISADLRGMSAAGSGRSPTAAEASLLLRGAYFFARIGHVTPTMLLKAIQADLRDFDSVAGAIWVVLGEQAAARVLAATKESNLISNRRITAEHAYGTAKFWIEDGRLTKLEVSIEGRTTSGHRPALGPRRVTGVDLKQVYTFTLSGFGVSTPDVPPEASEKLSPSSGAGRK